MTIDEFRLLCIEIFHTDDKNGKRSKKGFPSGCNNCPDKDNDDCFEYCMWPENYWKYEEVKNYWILAKAQNGGLDVNRMDSINFDDFIKLSIVKEYL